MCGHSLAITHDVRVKSMVTCCLDAVCVCKHSVQKPQEMAKIKNLIHTQVEGRQQGPPWYYLLQNLAHGQAGREIPHVLP